MDKLASFQKLSHVVCLTYSAVAGFREEEVHDDSLSSTPGDKDDVSLPANSRERDWPSKLVEQTASVDSQA